MASRKTLVFGQVFPASPDSPRASLVRRCARVYPQRRYCGYLRSSLAYRLILSLTACKTSGMNRSFSRLSAKEELILDMLISEGQMYGLEMVRASDNQLKRGTVYVTLGRMTEKGYVEPIDGHPRAGGPPRRKYRITGHGSRILQAWNAARSVFAEATP